MVPSDNCDTTIGIGNKSVNVLKRSSLSRSASSVIRKSEISVKVPIRDSGVFGVAYIGILEKKPVRL